MREETGTARVQVFSHLVALAGIACLVFVLSGGDTIQFLNGEQVIQMSRATDFSARSSNLNISATSGRTFSMSRKHAYQGPTFTETLKDAKANPLQPIGKMCERWAVMTTIFPPSQAALDVVGLQDWCLVVVGDRKSVPYALNGSHGHFVFLSAEDQIQLPYRIVQILPWNHFGRKNVGYLYAIHHGAEVIYDFDDDNLLLDGAKKASPLINPSTDKARLVYPDTVAWNPYPYYSKQAATWPRGFPLTMLHNPSSSAVPEPLPQIPAFEDKRIAVLQSLANHDPDVDAIYRLTGSLLPFDFTEHLNEPPLALAPRFSMMPYNAQATLHFRSAFFGLLLPVTVHGRVSDIWRSYFTQRVLWEADLAVGISPPWVKQVRNAHNYLADLSSEQDLYEKADALVKYLVKDWWPTADAVADLGTMLAALYVDMYEHDIIGKDDVSLLQAWLLDLKDAGYDAPAVTHHLQPPPSFPDLQLYVRMFSKYEQEYREKLFQSLDFFWPSHDLLVVLDSESEADRKLGPQLLDTGVTVAYSEPSKHWCCKNRMQHDMLNADKLTNATFVGFLDTDTVFVTQVLPQDLFQGDKPRVVGVLGLPDYGASDWQDMPLSTEFLLNKTEVFRGMNYFPVVIKTQHLLQLRQYVEKVHGQPFDEVFQDMLRRFPDRYSQFNIMVNYIWYFHANEYIFHLELAEGLNPPTGIRVNMTEAGVTSEMLQPFARVAVHWDYRASGPSHLQPIDMAPALLEGYCLSYGFSGTPELCNPVSVVDVQDYLFNFEGHNWMFDMDGCHKAHKWHYDRVARYWNGWNATMLREVYKHATTH